MGGGGIPPPCVQTALPWSTHLVKFPVAQNRIHQPHVVSTKGMSWPSMPTYLSPEAQDLLFNLLEPVCACLLPCPSVHLRARACVYLCTFMFSYTCVRIHGVVCVVICWPRITACSTSSTLCSAFTCVRVRAALCFSRYISGPVKLSDLWARREVGDCAIFGILLVFGR